MARFLRTVEDFTCAHCGAAVAGDGYTNHCPHCLWSAHVDVVPGDRAHSCGGLMEPTDVRYEQGSFRIVHQCTRCGHIHPNRVHAGDDPEVLRALIARTGTI